MGQNIIDQLMKKEQEITDHLLKSGKVENKEEQDQDEDEEKEASSCSRKEEIMDGAEEKVLEPGLAALFNEEDSGTIDHSEGEMVKGVLNLRSQRVKEIMRPRVDILAVPKEMSVASVLAAVRESASPPPPPP